MSLGVILYDPDSLMAWLKARVETLAIEGKCSPELVEAVNYLYGLHLENRLFKEE